MKKIFLFITAFNFCLTAFSQTGSVGIGTTTPDPSAKLDVQSTEKGMLIPRMTTAQRTAISNAATGLLVFDNTTGTFWFYNGTAWTELVGGGGSNQWTANGNNIYNTAGGNVGLGTTPSISSRLSVNGDVSLMNNTALYGWLRRWDSDGLNISATLANPLVGTPAGHLYLQMPLSSFTPGNVGIGKENPLYKLSIDGGIGLYNGTNIFGTLTNNSDRLHINAKPGNLITNTQPEHLILQTASGLGATSGNVGIGVTAPLLKLQIEGGTDASGTGGGFLQLGSSTAGNVGIDDNEIQARNNGAPAKLFLQAGGQDLQIGGTNNIIINDGYQVYRNRPLSSNADLLPIAYGNISASGNYLSGTGNLSVQRMSAGQYRILLLGENNIYSNANNYTIMVTKNDFVGGSIAAEIQSDNSILVINSQLQVSYTNSTCDGCAISHINSITYGTTDSDFSILIYKM